MALLTLQQVSAPSTDAHLRRRVGLGHGRGPDDRMFLIVKNAGGTPDTVTIVIPGNDQFGSAIPDPAITVPITTGERWIPLRAAMADPTTGAHHGHPLVQTTSVTCALVRR
jgi:hypothetical protein